MLSGQASYGKKRLLMARQSFSGFLVVMLPSASRSEGAHSWWLVCHERKDRTRQRENPNISSAQYEFSVVLTLDRVYL